MKNSIKICFLFIIYITFNIALKHIHTYTHYIGIFVYNYECMCVVTDAVNSFMEKIKK